MIFALVVNPAVVQSIDDVVHGYDAEEAPILRHRHARYAVFAHDSLRLTHRCVASDGDYGALHHVTHLEALQELHYDDGVVTSKRSGIKRRFGEDLVILPMLALDDCRSVRLHQPLFSISSAS